MNKNIFNSISSHIKLHIIAYSFSILILVAFIIILFAPAFTNFSFVNDLGESFEGKIEISTFFFVIEHLYFISGIFLIFGIILAYRSFKGEHEYNRRKFAIELIMDWNNNNKDGVTFLIRQIIKSLNSKQRIKIINYETFAVDNETYKLIDVCLLSWQSINHRFSQCKNVLPSTPNSCPVVELSSYEVIILRQLLVTYFNRLENIASAIINHVADYKMLTEQFWYLANTQDNYKGMLNDLGWSKSYPCLVALIHELEQTPYITKQPTG